MSFTCFSHSTRWIWSTGACLSCPNTRTKWEHTKTMVNWARRTVERWRPGGRSRRAGTSAHPMTTTHTERTVWSSKIQSIILSMITFGSLKKSRFLNSNIFVMFMTKYKWLAKTWSHDVWKMCHILTLKNPTNINVMRHTCHKWTLKTQCVWASPVTYFEA